jgi:hypothetical protein
LSLNSEFCFIKDSSKVWYFIPIIPTLGGRGKEDGGFKGSLGYTAVSKKKKQFTLKDSCI